MKTESEWIDIDNIYDTVPDVSSEPYELWTGTFYFRKDHWNAVPVTELEISTGFELWDTVRIGVGAFASIWWHTPAPPTWHVPGEDWYWGDQSGFELEYRNMIFTGASVSVTIKL